MASSIFELVDELSKLGLELERHVNTIRVSINGREELCTNISTQSWAGSPIRPFSRRWVYIAPGPTLVIQREIFRQGLNEPPVTHIVVVPWQRLTPKQQKIFGRTIDTQVNYFTELKGQLSL